MKVKEMMSRHGHPSDSNPFPFYKNSHFLVKFAASFLLFGIACRLLFSDSVMFSSSPVLTPPLPSSQPSSIALIPTEEEPEPEQQQDSADPMDLSITQMSHSSPEEKCDLFAGEWVPDLSGPNYTNRSCLHIQDHQNCMRNGRPDSGYLYWRWKPSGCDLPKFNPRKFLKLMRNKSLAFIGDSISRNHVQSLLCILSQVERAVEVYSDKEDKSKRWLFQSHNFTLSVVWAPFLIKADIFEDNNGVSSKETHLHLDKLDLKWADQYDSFDYAVIAGGKWFLKTAVYLENDEVAGCHYCPGLNLTELGMDFAYRKALSLALDFASKHRAVMFLRTATPDHFENGEWFSGGTCNRTVPFGEGEVDVGDLDRAMRGIELEEFEKAAAGVGSGENVGLKLLDTTRLSLLRPDGHPGAYMQFQPFAKDKDAKVQNDCLHWCLPGPIDSWNDLVMEMISNGGLYR